MEKDEQVLIEKAKTGDKDAFGKLYQKYLNRIFRFIYYLIHDYESSQDITQNTFMKAWNSLPRFDMEKGTLQSFLFTIARNTVIDFQRKKKSVSLETIEEIISNEDVEKEAIRSEEKQTILKALSYLETDEKQIIALRYFEELSFSEIAEVMQIKEGALRVRIHRILKKLKLKIT